MNSMEIFHRSFKIIHDDTQYSGPNNQCINFLEITTENCIDKSLLPNIHDTSQYQAALDQSKIIYTLLYYEHNSILQYGM